MMGLFLGSANDAFKSHANFQFTTYAVVNVGLFSVLSCTRWSCNDNKPMKYSTNAVIAWAITFLTSLVVAISCLHYEDSCR